MNIKKKAARKIYLEQVPNLIALNPIVFNKELPLPLEIGICNKIKNALGLSARQTRAVVRAWCSRWEYTCMLMSHTSRYNMAGVQVSDNAADNPCPRRMEHFPKVSKGNKKKFTKLYTQRYGSEPFYIYNKNKKDDSPQE